MDVLNMRWRGFTAELVLIKKKRDRRKIPKEQWQKLSYLLIISFLVIVIFSFVQGDLLLR